MNEIKVKPRSMKTSELTGHALDWAVAKCEGMDWLFEDLTLPCPGAAYSTEWAQGGPIIEREKLWIGYSASGTMLKLVVMEDAVVQCHKVASPCSTTGPTVLIAAMRCYVASKLGDTVDIPEELK